VSLFVSVCLQIEVAHKYSTVDTLRQQYLFIPAKYKDCYLAFVLNELSGSTAMVSKQTDLFCTQRLLPGRQPATTVAAAPCRDI
jgi:hypothetical protein